MHKNIALIIHKAITMPSDSGMSIRFDTITNIKINQPKILNKFLTTYTLSQIGIHLSFLFEFACIMTKAGRPINEPPIIP